MKKHFLLIFAIALLALPVKASDLADELCADEIFITLINECEQVGKHVLSLNDQQRKLYLASEDFACFSADFIKSREYLAKTFNLFDRADRKFIVSRAINKLTTDPAVCEWYFQIAYFNCFTIVDPLSRELCINSAIAAYNRCMGNPPEE